MTVFGRAVDLASSIPLWTGFAILAGHAYIGLRAPRWRRRPVRRKGTHRA